MSNFLLRTLDLRSVPEELIPDMNPDYLAKNRRSATCYYACYGHNRRV